MVTEKNHRGGGILTPKTEVIKVSLPATRVNDVQNTNIKSPCHIVSMI